MFDPRLRVIILLSHFSCPFLHVLPERQRPDRCCDPFEEGVPQIFSFILVLFLLWALFLPLHRKHQTSWMSKQTSQGYPYVFWSFFRAINWSISTKVWVLMSWSNQPPEGALDPLAFLQLSIPSLRTLHISLSCIVQTWPAWSDLVCLPAVCNHTVQSETAVVIATYTASTQCLWRRIPGAIKCKAGADASDVNRIESTASLIAFSLENTGLVCL